MELKELYQEIILDHGKNPRNKGVCSNYNFDAQAHNPLCGDKVHIYLNLDKDKKLAQKISEEILGMIKNKEKITINSLTEDQITTISSLAGVQEFPMRVKCATMVWHTFLSALNKKN
jgi:nitrogen fixation protein NifU and related proteins